MLTHQTLQVASTTAMEQFMENAIASVNTHWIDTFYDVAQHQVLLKTAGPQLHEFMHEALRHIISSENDPRHPDLIVYAVDEHEVGVEIPDAPWSWHTGDRDGYIHGVDIDRFTVNFDQATQSLRLIDRQRNIALHWMRNRSLVPYWERSFPLREILNWWYRDSSVQPVHAAAIGIDHKGALLTAKGGSGKSSTAISALLAGMQFAGDDFVLVDTDSLNAYSLYSIAKLEPHTLQRFPELKPHASISVRDQNKYQLSLCSIKPEGLCRKLEVRMILVPQITHGPVTFLSEIDKQEVSSALMLSTFYLLKGELRPTFRKITQLVETLPAYKLNLGTDFDNIPSVIQNALRNE